MVISRENMMSIELQIDLSHHNDRFFNIIDKLINLKYGKEIAELVTFYLYERINPDGSINGITDDKGREIVIKDIDDLWNLMLRVNPSIEK